MSKYTKQLKEIVEEIVKEYSTTPLHLLSHDDRIKFSLPYIFNFPIDLYDPNHLEELETKIIKHFYLREIGFETANLFQFELEEKINFILPSFNPLYESIALKYNILSNYKMHEETIRDINRNGSVTNNGSGNSQNVSYITPENIINTTNVDKYANAMERNTNSETSSGTSTEDSKDNYTSEREGYVGLTPGKLIQEFRQNIMNVDELFIRELDDLFIFLLD